MNAGHMLAIQTNVMQWKTISVRGKILESMAF